MIRSKYYPLYVWSTALFIAPFIIQLEISLLPNDHLFRGSLFEIIPFIWAVSFMASIPTLAIFTFFYLKLITIISNHFILKMLLDGICIIGIVLTFKVLGFTDELNFIVPYSLSAILASGIYKIPNKKPAISN